VSHFRCSEFSPNDNLMTILMKKVRLTPIGTTFDSMEAKQINGATKDPLTVELFFILSSQIYLKSKDRDKAAGKDGNRPSADGGIHSSVRRADSRTADCLAAEKASPHHTGDGA
jgi:hypothetical protein